MQTLDGYINDNAIVVDSNLSLYNGKKVIITVLDDLFSDDSSSAQIKATNKDASVKAAFGMWKDNNDGISVDETVRKLREGRCFDI